MNKQTLVNQNLCIANQWTHLYESLCKYDDNFDAMRPMPTCGLLA